VTFRRTATEIGLSHDALDFEAAFTIDIRGRARCWRQVPAEQDGHQRVGEERT